MKKMYYTIQIPLVYFMTSQYGTNKSNYYGLCKHEIDS